MGDCVVSRVCLGARRPRYTGMGVCMRAASHCFAMGNCPLTVSRCALWGQAEITAVWLPEAAHSGGPEGSLEHLDPAEEHLTLGAASGQEAASPSRAPEHRVGETRPPSCLSSPLKWSRAGGQARGGSMLSGPDLVVTWPLSPHISLWLFSILAQQSSCLRKEVPLLPIHSPNLQGRTSPWRMEKRRKIRAEASAAQGRCGREERIFFQGPGFVCSPL